jgi:hypothetical protein
MSLLDARTSRELRENGLLLPQQFIPWPRIKSHAWEGESTLILMVEKRRGLPSRQRLRVKPACKDGAEEILCQRLGNI